MRKTIGGEGRKEGRKVGRKEGWRRKEGRKGDQKEEGRRRKGKEWRQLCARGCGKAKNSLLFMAIDKHAVINTQ